ncbi:MAG: hypothetical protein ABL974_20140 [Prosthecobacter sp.]
MNSKYLGDTAKHIITAFAAARDHDAVELLDNSVELMMVGDKGFGSDKLRAK